MSAGGLPDLVARVRLDTSDLDKGVKKAAGFGGAIGGAIGGLAGGALGSAVDGLKEFAKGSVDAFAAVEDATGAAGVQFGNALPQVVSFADKAAASFGLSKRAALDAQNTFGTLGKAAGLQGAPLAGFSQKLTGLAGDLASFKGTSADQAIEAVGAALRGESEPIRAYGVMLNDASIQAEGLALGLAKPVVNAEKLAAANTRVKLATQGYTDAVKAHGAHSIEAEKAQLALTTATNAQKDAADGSIKPLSATNKTLAIQSLILKQTKDAQGDYARTSTSTANTQKTLQAETENASAALGAKLAPAMTAMRQGFLALIRGSSGMIDALGTISGAVTPVVAGLASGLQPAIGAIVTAFRAVAGAIPTPVLIALGAVLGTVAAAMVLQAAATAAWSAVTGAAAAVTALFATTVNAETGATERGLAARVAHNVAVAASAVVHGIAVAATTAWTAAQWLLNAALNANPIGLIVLAIAALVAGLILAWKHSETFRNIVTGAFNAVKDAAAAAFGWVQDHWKLLLGIITGPIGAAVILIATHWDTIKAGAGAVVSWITDKFDGLLSFFKGVPGKLAGAFRGAFDGLRDAFRAAVNFIIDGWNSLQFTMPSVDTHIPHVGKVGGFTIGVPDIPRLAQGGVVLATPGGTLVRAGEAGHDEAVVPLTGPGRTMPLSRRDLDYLIRGIGGVINGAVA